MAGSRARSRREPRDKAARFVAVDRLQLGHRVAVRARLLRAEGRRRQRGLGRDRHGKEGPLRRDPLRRTWLSACILTCMPLALTLTLWLSHSLSLSHSLVLTLTLNLTLWLSLSLFSHSLSISHTLGKRRGSRHHSKQRLYVTHRRVEIYFAI